MTSTQHEKNCSLERFQVYNTLSRLGSPWNLPEIDFSAKTIESNDDSFFNIQPITTNCIHDNGITEVVLEIEKLNGIPVHTMVTLIKFETMVASLYAAVRVHHRPTSMYGSLPIETIFKPLIYGSMCKGICHAIDIPGCLRILSNCLSRALFVHHTCVPFIYVQLLKCFSDCSPFYVNNLVNECCRTAAKDRLERYLRLLNNEMYNWRGFVIKPMTKRAPYSLYDMDIESAYHFQNQNEHHNISSEQSHICNIFTKLLCFSKNPPQKCTTIVKIEDNQALI